MFNIFIFIMFISIDEADYIMTISILTVISLSLINFHSIIEYKMPFFIRQLLLLWLLGS